MNGLESNAKTICDCLDRWAAFRPERTAFVFLNGEGKEADSLNFHELRLRSLAIASAIRSKTQRGSRAILLFHSGLDFICSFLGCLYAGVVAVPIPPPQGRRQAARMDSVLEDAFPDLILAKKAIYERVIKNNQDSYLFKDICWIDADAIDGDIKNDLPIEINENDIAFLQYTSGSTAAPKGVVIAHRQLMHNEIAIAGAFEHTEASIVGGWLPFHHDMGLIGNILHPIFMGIPCVLMSPAVFLQDPSMWLKTISKYRITTSGGPNFAYQLCCNRIKEKELEGVDLSCWKVAFNGSEMIHADTLEEFSAKFKSFGFKKTAFYPCYGLAESTLFATGIHAGTPVNVILREEKSPEGKLLNTMRVVGCGFSQGSNKVNIVNPETGSECNEDEVGEVWLSGPSIAGGYWNRLEESENTFNATLATGEGPFLKTGDLGFMHAGELFLVGRVKNLIIIRGRNLYPHDIEHAVQKCHLAFNGRQGAAFSTMEGVEESLVIIQEVDRAQLKNGSGSDLILHIKKVLSEDFLVDASVILLVNPGTIPKTTSGKVQYRCAARV